MSVLTRIRRVPSYPLKKSPLWSAVLLTVLLLISLSSAVLAKSPAAPSSAPAPVKAPAVVGETVLQSGVPFNTFLEALTYANAYIDVPAGATGLTVTLTNGSGDLDLYLKYGVPLIEFTSPAALSASADFRSEGPTASETITVTPASTPPLKAGKWYVATLNLNNTRTNFTVTATFQAPAGTTRTGNVPGAGTVLPTPSGSKPRGPIQEAPFVPSPETKHIVTPGGVPFVAVSGSTFAWKYGTTEGTAAGGADMYLALEIKGMLLTLLGDQLPGDIVPVFRRNVSIADGGTIEVLPEIPLPTGLPPGEYNFYAILVRAGNMPLDLNNWVSDVAFSTMRFSLLSPQQEAVIRDYGYPSQFVKTFIISDGEVRTDEVWAYGVRGVSVSFINGAFIEEGSLPIAGVPASAGLNHPENYQFDTTAQQIRERHGQPAESTAPPSASDLFSTIGANRFFSYNGIVFGFNNEQLVFVMSTK